MFYYKCIIYSATSLGPPDVLSSGSSGNKHSLGQPESESRLLVASGRDSAETVSELFLKKLKPSIALHVKPISELRSVTCHMGSHSVTCYPTQVNAPRPNPSQAGRYSIYLSPEGWKAE